MTRPERTRLIFPLFAIASLLASVAVACDEDQTAVTSAPADPEAFLERLEQVLTRNGKVYHVRMVATSVSEGTEQVSYRNEAWLYLANGEGRIEARRDPAWEIDRPLHELELTQKGSVYRWSEDIPTDPVTALTEAEAQVCISADVPRLVRIVPCALIAFSYSNLTLGVDADASFRSRETYALTMSVRYEPPRDLPPGGPTPGPAYTSVSRFHVDRESFLPVGVDSEGGDGYVTFEGDWIDRSTLPDDFFDPQALGYVPPGEEERRILEHPALGVPVHWLGRDADLGNGLPRLTLRGVDDRHPELPKLGDEPNVRLSLGYGSVDGYVNLDLWQPGEWGKFKARLGGKFAWSWCSETVEKQMGDARLVILLGHEPPPHELGDVTVVPITPGAPPPTLAPNTPTIPPVRTDPCPSKPYDRFMAEMHYPDVTVVINGTLFYGGQEGKPFGAFDDPEALEAVARALTLRQHGQ